MKILHISDLHFGKKLHGFSLIDNEDQPFWARQFLKLVDEKSPDVILIAGDVYDNGNPSKEAISLLSDFLTSLLDRGIPVMMVAGNHDSGERLSFLSNVLDQNGLYIAGQLEREMKHVTLRDEDGDVTFWLLPFVFPSLVSDVLDDPTIRDYDTAVRKYLAAQDIDFSQRNVLIAHQNVLANGVESERGGSETMIGGVGEIDYTAFDGFDYVALGHIHAAQSVGRPAVRYAGSPLCYHFSEIRKPRKGPVYLELNAKGTPLTFEICELPVRHRMRELRGAFSEVLDSVISATEREEYIRVVLTDDNIPVDASAQLRALLNERGSFLMEVVRDVNRPVLSEKRIAGQAIQDKPLDALFSEFYADRTGGAILDHMQMDIVRLVARQVQMSDSPEYVSDQDIDEILKYVMEQEAE